MKRTITRTAVPLDAYARKVKLLPTVELTDMLVRLYNYRPEMVEALEDELRARGVNLHALGRERDRLLMEEDLQYEEGRSVRFIWVLLPFLLLNVVGGIIGGCFFAFSKTSGYCGKTYYRYDRQTRYYARSVLLISLCLLLVGLFFLTR